MNNEAVIVEGSLEVIEVPEEDVILVTESATFLDVSVDNLIFTDGLKILWTDGLKSILLKI